MSSMGFVTSQGNASKCAKVLFPFYTQNTCSVALVRLADWLGWSGYSGVSP